MDPDKPNKPGNSAFKQQKIKSWSLNISKMCLSYIYIICGIFFLIVGSVIVVESNKVIEHRLRYDNLDECKAHWKTPSTCILKLKLDDKMKSPIFIYYEISNMYQNHRLYNKNRDSLQLHGETRTESEISINCSPVKKMEDLGIEINNPQLTPKSIANPCGLIARSYFNDTYHLSPVDTKTETIKISFEDIAWSIDKDKKFKKNDHPQVQ